MLDNSEKKYGKEQLRDVPMNLLTALAEDCMNPAEWFFNYVASSLEKFLGKSKTKNKYSMVELETGNYIRSSFGNSVCSFLKLNGEFPSTRTLQKELAFHHAGMFFSRNNSINVFIGKSFKYGIQQQGIEAVKNYNILHGTTWNLLVDETDFHLHHKTVKNNGVVEGNITDKSTIYVGSISESEAFVFQYSKLEEASLLDLKRNIANSDYFGGFLEIASRRFSELLPQCEDQYQQAKQKLHSKMKTVENNENDEYVNYNKQKVIISLEENVSFLNRYDFNM